MSDFDILTSTRAWVAVPWDFNSCIGLRFRSDGSGDMVFARLQILRAEIRFRFSLQASNELTLIYHHDAIAWKILPASAPRFPRLAQRFPTIQAAAPSTLKEGGKPKAIQYSLKEGEITGETPNLRPFKFYWTLSFEKSPFPDEVQLGVVEQPREFYGHNANEPVRLADTED